MAPTGKGSLYPQPSALPDDHPLRLGQQEDLQALGLVFLELIFAALCEGGPSDKAAATDGALQRLWLEVFKCDAREFRCDVILHASAPLTWAASLLQVVVFEKACVSNEFVTLQLPASAGQAKQTSCACHVADHEFNC